MTEKSKTLTMTEKSKTTTTEDPIIVLADECKEIEQAIECLREMIQDLEEERAELLHKNFTL